jgi:hypothetical protein
LIAHDRKRIETRSWPTNIRGLIAIHAAKYFPRENQDFARRVGLDPDTLRRTLGHVIATTTLHACLEIPEQTTWFPGLPSVSLPPPAPECGFGNYEAGRFAWLLRNTSALQTPCQWRGGQRFFNVTI